MCSRIAADCRSRQAAFGPSRPGVKSLGHDVGSSRSGREHRGGESAPEAGSSVAKPRHRWRVPTKTVTRKRDSSGTPVDGRRSGSNKPHPLTRGRGKRSSVLRGESGPRDLAARGVRQRASEVVHQPGTRSTTPRRGGSHHRVGALGSTPSLTRRGEARVVGRTEAGDRAVKRALPGAGSPFSPRGEEAGWRRSRPRVSTHGSGTRRRRRSARRKPRARESGDPRVLVS